MKELGCGAQNGCSEEWTVVLCQFLIIFQSVHTSKIFFDYFCTNSSNYYTVKTSGLRCNVVF